jgi:hypothetical protein
MAYKAEFSRDGTARQFTRGQFDVSNVHLDITIPTLLTSFHTQSASRLKFDVIFFVLTYYDIMMMRNLELSTIATAPELLPAMDL